jgi:uncharacterized lipoprotein YddW (UPF0748 family)
MGALRFVQSSFQILSNLLGNSLCFSEGGKAKVMYPYKLMVILMVFICSAAFGSERLTIDSFEYAGSSEARSAWKPQAESPSVVLMPHRTDEGEQALLLPCDFSRKEERCYWDREVALDLTKFGKFSLWVYAENPQAVGTGTLYLQSGDGWFAGRILIARKGWQRISLWKSDFRIEDSPTGWNDIGTIRISFWNATNTDTVVAVDDLEAVADEIVIVLGDLTMRKRSSDARTVQSSCSSMAKMLEDSGIAEFGVVNDTDVESGALSGCKLAIFPFNPDISDEECKAIERLVESGGKFMLFYSLPERLAELLGVEVAGWMRAEYPGQFSSIGLEVESVEGLPEMIAQGSWNIRIPKPRGPETKVVGEWVDAEGKRTGIPAITIGTNGVFMGHVLLPKDAINKRQMLLALFGKLVPDMRQFLSEAVLQSAGKISGFEGFSEVSRFIGDNVSAVPVLRGIEALQHLVESRRLLIRAERASVDDQYGETLKITRTAMKELQEAFLGSFPSRKGEFRALWCHSAFGIPGWDWDKAIGWIKVNGFNAIVPNMLWAGVAYYPSEVLPVAEEVEERGDQIAQCLEACRKYGVQIHVWKVNWNLSRAPEKFVEQLREEGRLQKDRRGNEVRWLCPSDPKNLKLELESMLEIARKYDVDGIHFDYIRYPHSNACYCPKCRERFEKSRGLVSIQNWPEEVISGKYAEDFTQWRCDQITRLVKSVSEQAHKINPEIKVSAAVFRDYPRCRQTVGQDWKAWIESGYLDFVCPMDYTADNNHLRNLVVNQVDIVSKRVPLYPGIGASAPGLPPEQVAMQVHIARNLGVDGFIVFNYDLSVATGVLPALFKGITSE